MHLVTFCLCTIFDLIAALILCEGILQIVVYEVILFLLFFIILFFNFVILP